MCVISAYSTTNSHLSDITRTGHIALSLFCVLRNKYLFLFFTWFLLCFCFILAFVFGIFSLQYTFCADIHWTILHLLLQNCFQLLQDHYFTCSLFLFSISTFLYNVPSFTSRLCPSLSIFIEGFCASDQFAHLFSCCSSFTFLQTLGNNRTRTHVSVA